MRNRSRSEGSLYFGWGFAKARRRQLLIVAVAATLLLFAAPLVYGLPPLVPPPWMVSNASDSFDTSNSLRWAIYQANLYTGTSNPEITFAPSLDGQTITLSSGTLEITKSVDIEGPSEVGALPVTIDGGGNCTVFKTSGTGLNVTISHLTISNGRGVYGGGIYAAASDAEFTLEDCTVTGCSGTFGGGINCTDGVHSATLVNCTFYNNTAAASGGGVFSAAYQLTLINCTFVDNKATFGGGMFTVGGEPIFAGNCTATYCTFTENTAGDGAALYNASAMVTLGATIIAGNTLTGGTAPSDIDNSGTVTSEGYNLIGITSGTPITYASGASSSTDLIGEDPKLGPLADNGGSVETCALPLDSPAINIVPPTAFPSIKTDARGVIRPQPQGGRCDIGAYEYMPRGDVNGDGVINILDVRLCLQIAEGVIQGTAAQRQEADFDGDGQVTLADAQLLADLVAGIATP